jgi:hypothetical protein
MDEYRTDEDRIIETLIIEGHESLYEDLVAITVLFKKITY